MKKFWAIITTVFLAIILISSPAEAQKKKETGKERRARIAKMVQDGAAGRDFFIAIGRFFPKSGTAQHISYSTDGYFIDVQNDRISCNVPYVGQAERSSNTPYNLSNTNINICADNQIITLFGGWQEKEKSYIFRTIFWNNDDDTGNEAIQVILTVQLYTSGKAYAQVEIQGMELISYEGEIEPRPEKKQIHRPNEN